MSDDPSQSVMAWKRLVIEKLRPEPGDLLIVRSPDRKVRHKAADALEEALEENGLGGKCSIIVGHTHVTITHITEKQMKKLGWVRDRTPPEISVDGN